MPFFICPSCKNRSLDHDGRQGLSRQAVACERCGFGFLFELLDDYYPSPTTGLVACDRNGRVLAAGRGVFELTGYREGEVMGKDVVDAFGLAGYDEGKSPVALALEWGVQAFGFRGVADIAALPLFALAMLLFGLLVMPAGNFMSRRMERAADRYALQTTGKREAFRSVMLKLASQNLSDADPPAWVRALFGSHPAVSERVRLADET